MRRRVVWGLSETIATFPPQSAFTSVDFPTFGRPATATMPLFIRSLLDVAARSPHPSRVGEFPLTLWSERTARKRARPRQFCADSSRQVPRLGQQLCGRVGHDLAAARAE